jgi:redox-sensitive bicupin YhaK (pirin superfamily)
MLKVRKSNERGKADYGWLNAKYSFSFASYFEAAHVGISDLLVMNEDTIAPAKGFDVHPHKDMEIITYVIEGAIEHKDSMGYHGVVGPGEIQYISSGTGITHSEFNHLTVKETKLIQIWIKPDKKGHSPKYGQASFKDRLKQNELCLIVSGDGRDDSVKINQDVSLYTAKYEAGLERSYDFEDGRVGWLQVISGKLKVNGLDLDSGDGVSILDLNQVNIHALVETNFLLFDLRGN